MLSCMDGFCGVSGGIKDVTTEQRESMRWEYKKKIIIPGELLIIILLISLQLLHIFSYSVGTVSAQQRHPDKYICIEREKEKGL